jgi:4-amino-4-deoxy-L-arabinose transferase-like glycosyltransferase
VLLYGGGYCLPLATLLQIWSQWTAGETFGELLHLDWHAAMLPVRAWSALLSTSTIALAFAAGRHLGGAATGIMAALLLAVAPIGVREAHFAKPDSAAAFSAAVLVFAMARPWSSVARHSVALGAAAAFVISTKLCAGFLPGVVFALAWPGSTPERVIDRWSLLTGAAAFGLVWVALNPFLVMNPVDIWTSAKVIHGWFSTADWLPGSDLVPGPLRYHARILLRYGCGAPFALLVVPAIVYALAGGGVARSIAIAIFGYAATLALSPMVLARFFLPALPGLCVLVALFVVDGIRRVARSARMQGSALPPPRSS